MPLSHFDVLYRRPGWYLDAPSILYWFGQQMATHLYISTSFDTSPHFHSGSKEHGTTRNRGMNV